MSRDEQAAVEVSVMNNIHEIAREWAQKILPDPLTVESRRDPYEAAHEVEDAARKDAAKRGAPTEPEGWDRDVGAWRTQLRIALTKRIEASRGREAARASEAHQAVVDQWAQSGEESRKAQP